MQEDRLLIFPPWDTKIKYLSIFILCSLIRKMIPKIIEEFSFAKIQITVEDEDTLEQKKITSYFDLLSNFIADFSVIIIILINKCRRGSDYQVTTKTGEITLKNMRKLFFILMSILAIIDIVAQFCLFLPSIIMINTIDNEEKLYFVVFIDIISRYIFSRIILKGHFYKHQIVAIIITLIGFIPFIVYNIIDIRSNIKSVIFYLHLYVFMTVLYSLEDVLNKICLNKLIITPFELMFYKAVFQIIFVVLITLYMFTQNLSYYIQTYVVAKIAGRLIYRLSFIISNIFRTWSLITIIHLANPNFLSILKSSEFAILFLFNTGFNMYKKNIDKNIIIIGIFCFIFSMIGSAIHNEMVIINRCGLYKCTDYYKVEIKSAATFNTIDESISDKEKNDDTDNSILNSSAGDI